MTKKKESMVLDSALVMRALKIIDKGLINGAGDRAIPGSMCVEQAVALATEEAQRGQSVPTDHPRCVNYRLAQLKISLNDTLDFQAGSDSEESRMRARVLRRVAIAQLGTRGVTRRGKSGKVRGYELPDGFRKDVVQRFAALRREIVLKEAQKKGVSAGEELLLQAWMEIQAERPSDDIRGEFWELEEEIFTFLGMNLSDSVREPPTTSDLDEEFAHFINCYADAAVRLKMFSRREDALKWGVEQIVQALVTAKAPGAKFLELTRMPKAPRF